MAEQSMFWPTDGTGDGTSGGYTDARLKTIWKAALGNGVLQYLNNLAATGTGTSTLAVNTGAALVEGYLYENTASASIDTSGLGSATYGLYVIANEDVSSITVSRSVAGTTIGAKTTRLALNSTTPTQPYIKIATVVTSGGSITSITAENNRYASSRVKTSGTSTLSTATRTTNQSIPHNTSTTITWGSATNGEYATIDTSTGVATIKEAGVYIVQCQVDYAANSTGIRLLFLRVNSSTVNASQFIYPPSSSAVRFNTHYTATFSAGDTINAVTEQYSGGALNLAGSWLSVARLG